MHPVDSYLSEGSHSIRIGISKFVPNFLAEVALESIQVSLKSLTRVVMVDKIALHFFLLGQGRVCVIVNSFCCSWINAFGQVERLIQKLRDNAVRLSFLR